MEVIRSISSPARVFDTNGSKPALILCDDLDFYVCKYNRISGTEAKKLFHEYLAGSFAKLWKLAIPEFRFVLVDPLHIDGHDYLQPAFFRTPCFGSKYNNRFSEIDEFYGERMVSLKKQFGFRQEFLKIALFDIWLANEDRNFNNYNLLIDVGNQNRFVPIDHDAIFNTGNLDKGLVLLADNETLITTNITSQLFTPKELRDQHYLEKIRNEYYICTSVCKTHLTQILSEVPKEWNVNVVDYQNLLQANLFNDLWIKNCFNHFIELIHLRAQR